MKKHFILATAGHVDHGKSVLVKALTGIDPDRLPEEKARGMTIDLGFAELNLVGPSGEEFRIGIVDVPGHEDFVRNMIAGVGSIDLALLVVAADDGWMPQTEEHLQILTYLGIKRVLVALTKCDLGRIELVSNQIRERLKDTPFADSLIIPTSVRTHAGIENLKSALAGQFAKLAPSPDIGKPRLFVDRAFALRGIGTVITGTLTSGTLRVGDKIFVQPHRHAARVRSLQTHGRDVDFVQPGTRTAINLPDVAVGCDVKRGNVITVQDFEPTSTLDVLLSRAVGLERVAPIKSGSSAYVHHGTTRVHAQISFADCDSLAPGKTAVAQLRLRTPLLVFVGDRLIVRDSSEQHTIAGGVVFNIDPTGFVSDQQRGLLASRAVAPNDVALAVWTEISSKGVIEPPGCLERSRFSGREIANALQRLADHGEIFLNAKIGATMLVWRKLREQAARLVDAAHKAHPHQQGLDLNELRAGLSSISPVVFDELIVDLCRDKFVRAGSGIARRTHHASLPPELESAANKIRVALSAKPFDPPSRKEFLQDRHLQQAMRFLREQGEIVEISDEIILLSDAFDKMRATVSDFLLTNGPATASQLRQALGTSRRVIIPLLEYLDRTGVTRRTGDERALAQKAAIAKLSDAANTPAT